MLIFGRPSKMRAPKAFLPKKRLEKQVKDLSVKDKYLVRSAEDLILESIEIDNSQSERSDKISDSWFETNYPYFSPENIVEKRFTDYKYKHSWVTVDVMKFKDKTALKSSIQADWKKNFCDYYLKAREGSILVKDNYIVIIYTQINSPEVKRDFVSAFKKKFGFEEYKK